ncbi:MAG: phosphoglycerate kinase [Bacillota bacterium]
MKKSVRELQVRGKRVLLRVDFNVPMADGDVTDDTRIRASLPTIEYLLEQDARIILVSHRGRPKGKVLEALRMDPVARRLADILERPVTKASDVAGASSKALAAALQPCELLLLENVRFHPGEEVNDEELAREMASLADVFVNDAFGTAHRAHASTVGVAKHLPSVAGLLMSREIESLSRLLAEPARPFIAVLGGIKVSDKIRVLQNLAGKADMLLLGGGMANTFLSAKGFSMGTSIIDNDGATFAREMLEKTRGCLHLPVDLLVAPSVWAGESARVPVDAVPPGLMALDIGPRTVAAYRETVVPAGTVFWNGPMGVFENPVFAGGTREMAKAIASCKGVTVVGGGDSIAALKETGVYGEITHVSTGGGASLEFLEGRSLPGIEVLMDR